MLLAFYDYALSPPSFDFLTFTICAKTFGLQNGHDDLNVCFIPGPNEGFKEKTIKPINIEEHKYRHSHLVLPLTHMMGARVWEPGYRMADTPGMNIFPPGYTTEKPFPAHTLGAAFKLMPKHIGKVRKSKLGGDRA